MPYWILEGDAVLAPRSVSNAVAQAASVLAAKQLVDEHIDVVAGDREKAALRLSRPEHRQI